MKPVARLYRFRDVKIFVLHFLKPYAVSLTQIMAQTLLSYNEVIWLQIKREYKPRSLPKLWLDKDGSFELLDNLFADE